MSSSTKTRLAARTLALAAVAAGVTATSAQAYVPSPGFGDLLATDRADLRDATVALADFGDGEPELVRFCFDESVDPASGLFVLHTYDATRSMESTRAISDPDNKCVLAQFPNGTDVAQGTVATANAGAVTLRGTGRGNLANSVPLGGSVVTPQPGATTAPDLLGVTVRPGGTSAIYRFDENIGTVTTEPARFRAQIGSNAPFGATQVLSSTATEVTVQFSQNLAEAQRFTVDQGAVTDRAQQRGPGGQNDGRTGNAVGTFGNAGAFAVLQSATRIDGRRFDLQFSTDVNPGAVGNIRAVTDNGLQAVAGSPAVQGGGRITVTFNTTIAEDPQSVVRIVDLGGGAQTRDTPAIPTVPGTAVVNTPNARPGFTNGPDLVKAVLDATRREIAFTFDEAVRDTSATTSRFFAAGQPGDVFEGTNDAVGTDTLTVQFPSTAAQTVGAGVFTQLRTVDPNPANDPAIEDRITVRDHPVLDRGLGAFANGAPTSAVSYATQPFPAAAPPAVQPSGTPAPTPVARTTQRFATLVSLKRSGRASRRKYSGRITSSGPGCRAGRRIVFKRVDRRGQGRTIRLDDPVFTKGDGTFVLRRKRFTGRVYVFVTERNNKTRGVLCRSGVSKRLRG